MASRNATVCIFVFMAIGAIIAGSLSIVVGERDLFNSLQMTKDITKGSNKNLTGVPPASPIESETQEDNFPSSGSWSIFSGVNGVVSAHCHSQLRDLGIASMNRGTEISWNFPIPPYFAELWFCQFRWDSPSGPLQQDFEVWGHDGQVSYLYRCFDCEWTVQVDGFYIKYSDGDFYKQWKWNPAPSGL